MAGGKLSPRQKMINLMYLVFIAMMALNMSKEVLSAFGLMNEKLTAANTIATERNSAFMTGLADKVSEQPEKYTPLKQKADEISTYSNEFNAYVEQLKSELLETADDPTDYETMDKPDALDTKFFEGGKTSAAASEFLEKIKTYREGVVTAIRSVKEVDGQVATDVEKAFSTEDVENRDKVKVDWLKYNFEGFPLVASLTKLTQMQADVKTTESKVLSALLAGQQASELSFSNYEAIVVPDKTAFFSGEKFKGRIVLGRFDATLKPTKVMVNGKEQTEVQNGQIMLDFPAGNVGERKIDGVLEFKEGDSIIPIKIQSTYAVIPKPNSAVISADKMNVVYRGVQNPMTISIPGVPAVSASAPGLKKSGGAGKYVMNVTTVKAREVAIKVSGKLPNGTTVSDSKKFRIKDIPRPVGTARGEDGSIKMSKSGLEKASIGAILPDFDFDIKLDVTSFKFKVSGQPTINVRGRRLDSRAKSALKKAKRGSTVQVMDIKAQLKTNKGYKLKKISPVVIELTN
ncbi:gliding motility protein GldM [Aquimarina sp. MMG015]|uniref:type IX secretion system motor protein PorM/GldM n=1 Tax=Aquimarina TaxID=290174 RepID=UPI000418A6E3|nr:MULTISPECIES: gliding motility protein GldM [Aquimarina]AXT56804.1 gliding motility protein GldM [Aquimarina sp. AD1]MBQ4802804.1 gliding motility protein GldM [Aquimarina sp. MMG015]RKN31941.1 gliding motility protein GldM [Aquimarina sp. AD1]